MFLTDLLFPKFCLGCGYLGTYLCFSCQNKLKPIDQDICLYCKKPSLFGLTHPNCRRKLDIDGLLTLYHYNPILKKIIKNIKYRLATDVWQEFYKTINPDIIQKLGFYKRLSSDYYLQPIPLSKNKYQERGFNQAQVISMFFQKFLRFPIIDLLIKKESTLSQAQLSNKRKRFLNIQGAFSINPNGQNVINRVSNLILIDDVITSGSTVKEAAQVLKKAGIEKVYVLALARG